MSEQQPEAARWPLTGRPWRWETAVTDGEAEDAAEVARGLALPPAVRLAVQELGEQARTYAAEVRDHGVTMAATEAHIATLADALARLVRVRVNVSEAARMTGYERSHILRLIRAGTLYAERDGRNWRIPVYALDALPPRSPAGRPRKHRPE